jgi:predicted SAM-dependent methyltransferase
MIMKAKRTSKAQSPVFLHVGCGSKDKTKTTLGFNTEAWQELRLDINPSVKPDIVGSMTDMSELADQSVDAIFSSHNLEHLYAHEVGLAINEFKRVLKPDGFLVLTCPDLQSVCAAVADNRLTDVAYQSSVGPIAAIDMLYGHRAFLKAGQTHMAHRCGFTEKVLVGTFKQGGFRSVASVRRQPPFYDIWMIATLDDRTEKQMAALVQDHFPMRQNKTS